MFERLSWGALFYFFIYLCFYFCKNKRKTFLERHKLFSNQNKSVKNGAIFNPTIFFLKCIFSCAGKLSFLKIGRKFWRQNNFFFAATKIGFFFQKTGHGMKFNSEPKGLWTPPTVLRVCPWTTDAIDSPVNSCSWWGRGAALHNSWIVDLAEVNQRRWLEESGLKMLIEPV